MNGLIIRFQLPVHCIERTEPFDGENLTYLSIQCLYLRTVCPGYGGNQMVMGTVVYFSIGCDIGLSLL
jgi:hypothetical protein